MTEILDDSSLHLRAGKVLDKSSINFKAGSFESISKTIDSLKARYYSSECTRIRDEVKDGK